MPAPGFRENALPLVFRLPLSVTPIAIEPRAASPTVCPTAAKTRRYWAVRLAKLAGRVLLTAYFIFALLILGLRYVLLPHVEDYRGDLERLLSSSLELPVAIGHIDAHWNGLNPWLSLHGVQLHDRQHRPALTLDNIEAELSWTSLLFFDLRLP